MFYAAGFVTGYDGTANISAHLDADALPRGIDVLLGNGLMPGNVFGAEIHLLIRSHGSLIPWRVAQKIGSVDGACDVNVCAEQQAVGFNAVRYERSRRPCEGSSAASGKTCSVFARSTAAINSILVAAAAVTLGVRRAVGFGSKEISACAGLRPESCRGPALPSRITVSERHRARGSTRDESSPKANQAGLAMSHQPDLPGTRLLELQSGSNTPQSTMNISSPLNMTSNGSRDERVVWPHDARVGGGAKGDVRAAGGVERDLVGVMVA